MVFELLRVQKTKRPGAFVMRADTRKLNNVDLCSRFDKFEQLHHPCEEKLFSSADSKPEHDRIDPSKRSWVCKKVAIEGSLILARCNRIPVRFAKASPLV